MKITFYFSVISVCFLLCVLSGELSAQENQYPNTALPSASSAALISSVNHSTGRVDVSVPLFTFESSGIRVPVGISYNTSGIRVEDPQTEIGYGWRLTAGGKITRVVRQRPDDLQNTSQVWGSSALGVAQVFFKSIDQSKYVSYNGIDSEPDLFYYEIPGKSGMFVLDGQGNPHTIPYQPDLTISVVDGAYFIIRDNAGTVYRFGSSASSQENTTVTFKNENLRTSDQTEIQRYVSTWHLENITDYYGCTVTFSYRSGRNETTTSATHIATYENNMPYAPVSDSWGKISEQTHEITASTTTQLISSINADQKSITFDWYFPSRPVVQLLGNIHYIVNNSIVKKQHFTYDTFANYRVFLTQIDDDSPTDARQNLCSFTYNKSQLLPPHDSYDYDSWGYYNGKNNSSHLPVVPPSSPWAKDLSVEIPGADKSPVLEYAQACILTAIVYNTGGKVEYAYGLNEHQGNDIGGLRVEKVTYRDENNREVSSVWYEYDNSALGGLGIMPGHFSRPLANYNPFTLAPLTVYSQSFYNVYFTSGSHILYGKITEIASDGSKVRYDYSTPNTITGYTRIYANLPSTFWQYLKSTGELQEAVGTQPAVMPQTSRYWRHGLLLKQTKYDSNGATIEETTYTYKHDHSKLIIIKGFAPCVLKDPIGNDAPHLFEYSWESQPVLLASTTTTSSVAPTVTTEHVYDPDRVVPISTAHLTPDKTMVTNYRYAHNLTPASNAVNHFTDRGILAPVETVTRVNGQVTAAELTEYGFAPLNHNNQLVVLPRKKYYLPLSSPVGIVTRADYDGTGRFVYDSRYKLFQTMEYEPEYGRLQTVHTPEGRVSTVLYAKDPNGLRIDEQIAEVSNATVREVFYESFEYSSAAGVLTTDRAKTGRKVYTGASFYAYLEDFFPGTYVLSYWKSTDAGQSWQKHSEEITVSPYDDIPSTTISNTGWIDEVRVHPAEARMKTRTYLPGVGVSSETDHNGRTVYREYDTFGQLSRVLDNERRVLETYEYNLINE